MDSCGMSLTTDKRDSDTQSCSDNISPSASFFSKPSTSIELGMPPTATEPLQTHGTQFFGSRLEMENGPSAQLKTTLSSCFALLHRTTKSFFGTPDEMLFMVHGSPKILARPAAFTTSSTCVLLMCATAIGH
jgi:hypothetical protein